VYNSEKNWFLSEVWLDQARRKWGGRYVDIPVCEENTFGWEFYKVRPEKDDVVVTKHRFDAFMDTDLDVILRSKGIKTLIITGLVTNVCVETTTRHAFLKDYYVVVPDDCVAAYTLKSHLNSLENIDNYFGEVTSSHEIIRIWKRKKLLSS
jgi:ureidoacrylate peracid hydrolase